MQGSHPFKLLLNSSGYQDFNVCPQYLQNLASGSWPPLEQLGQAAETAPVCDILDNSTVTIPVGTAMMA